MRFFVSGDVCREEVIGEQVHIDQAPDEIFAVHRTHVGSEENGDPLWAVSHVETGLRCAAGDSIDFAIELARKRFAEKTPQEISDSLRQGRERLADNLAKPIGPLRELVEGDER